MQYLLYVTFLGVILFGFFIIGGFLKSILKLNDEINNILIGSSFIFGILFIISFPLIYLKSSFNQLFVIFILINLILISFGIFRINYKFNLVQIISVIIIVVFLLILSSRLPLGEQMGDNVFYFQRVSLNIDNHILQSFNDLNGVIYNDQISSNDNYFTFYLFFSILDKIYVSISQFLNIDTFPNYVYTMWLANGLFFSFIAIFTFNLIEYLNIKNILLKSSIIVFIVFFLSTYYYNLSLAHIGNTFMYFFISFSVLLIFHYLKEQKFSIILIYFFTQYAIVSTGNTGVIVSFYLTFSLIVSSLIFKDKNAFLMLSFLFYPVFNYLFLLHQVDTSLSSISILSSGVILIMLITLLTIVSISLYFYKKIHNFLFKLSYIVLALFWFCFLVISFKKFDNYIEQVQSFFTIKANFDRVQDYFSFSDFYGSVSNIVQYVLVLSLILNKNTRKIGIFILIIVIFFINPLMYPLISHYILWLYQRAYFVIFNLATLGIGIYAFANLDFKKVINFGMYIIIIFSIIFGFRNILIPISPIYVKSDNFNFIYKLPQNQVDILEKTRQIIEIENIKTPTVVSQIYSTLFYLEKIYILGFTVDERRGLYYLDNYSELLQIFYTPVFTGDDGLRLNAPVKKTCQLLMDSHVDFVIYDKTLSVYDENVGNWIPTYWYARDCYTKVYENDRYILFRFFW